MCNLEDLNRQIIACRMLDKRLNQQCNASQPVIHEDMLESVRDHRKYFGMVSKISILRQLVKTKQFVKTVKL